MVKADLLDNIKRSLGYPTIMVHTEDETIKMNLDIAFDTFTAKVLRKVTMALPLRGITRFNPYDVRIIYKVTPFKLSNPDVSVYSMDVFNLSVAVEYYNQCSDLLTPILASMVQSQLGDVTGKKFNWKYDTSSRALYCTNIPQGASVLVAEAKVMYEWDTLPKSEMNWIFGYALALTKIVEGRIRSKYREGATALISDGETLISEGKEEQAQLQESLENFISLNIGVRR